MLSAALTFFLCGDVMLGRGVDQIMPTSVDPGIHERYMKDAGGYVTLAEQEAGPIPRDVDPAYVWGEALGELKKHDPAARIVNLETAVTDTGEPWPAKGIHYRMHPQNVAVLQAAQIDVAVLGNNHAMDWGLSGLRDTLKSLEEAGISAAGAGLDASSAAEAAVVAVEGAGDLRVFSFALPSSGVPERWAARDDQPGLNRLPDLSDASFARARRIIANSARPDDIVVFSVHWGGNWGYAVPEEQQRFARRLIDEAGVDIVHGHSSHHPKAIEVHQSRLILYGAGDFLNDYEGIGGHERFRPQLTLMYLPTVDHEGRLQELKLLPMRIEKFQLDHASPEETEWLAQTLDRESTAFGLRLSVASDGSIGAGWSQP